MYNTGSKVKVKDNLEVGLGVREEQLEYAGEEMIVDRIEGYGVYLQGCDFVWKFSDIEEV